MRSHAHRHAYERVCVAYFKGPRGRGLQQWQQSSPDRCSSVYERWPTSPLATAKRRVAEKNAKQENKPGQVRFRSWIRHDSRTLTATSSSALHRCILAAEAVYPPILYFGPAECAPKRFANISRIATDRDLRCAIVIFCTTYYALVSSIAQTDENKLKRRYAQCSFSFYTRIDITFCCIAVYEDKVTNCFKLCKYDINLSQSYLSRNKERRKEREKFEIHV